jgi:hypothetical protein
MGGWVEGSIPLMDLTSTSTSTDDDVCKFSLPMIVFLR